MRRQRLVLIGSLPPPLGGVTIHLSRLIDKIEGRVNFIHHPLTLCSLLKLPYWALTNRAIHMHTSNSFVRVYSMLICRLLGASGIVTFHGNLDQYQSSIQRYLLRQAVKYARYPIVLNQPSYVVAHMYNRRTRLLPAFIAPNIQKETLSQECREKIDDFRRLYGYLVCTNASAYALDVENREIYGILEIIEMVRQRPTLGLVISDPSGEYMSELGRRSIELPKNVLLISQEHSFYLVLRYCDASIRNTSTDGDSLSVKESLFLGKTTLATDVVSRPLGCYTYPYGKINQVIDDLLSDREGMPSSNKPECGSIGLLELYKTLYL